MIASSPAVLFVCLGNICRSPLAEAALRHRLAKAGLQWTIDSAGVSSAHAGEPPDKRAQAVARLHGADISSYRARAVEDADFQRFTHIFAMDRSNLQAIHQRVSPRTTASVSLLLDLVDNLKGKSVADPYYGDPLGFERTWTQVDQAAQAIIDRLTAT